MNQAENSTPRKTRKTVTWIFLSLLLVAVIIIGIKLLLPKPKSNGTFLRDNVVVNQVSYDLFTNKIALKAKVVDNPLRNYKNQLVPIDYFDLPEGALFAHTTGYIITLIDTAVTRHKTNKSQFYENSKTINDAIKIFVQNGYKPFSARDKLSNAKYLPEEDKLKMDSISKLYTFLVPDIFLSTDYNKIDNFLDYKLGEYFFDKAIQWEENYFEIQSLKSENDSLNAENVNLKNILDAKLKEKEELSNRYKKIQAVHSLVVTDDDQEPIDKTIRLTYTEKNDYLLPVLKDYTVEIPKGMYSNQASVPRVDQDLLNAWTEFVTTEKENLKELGADKIKIVSGSRTPLKQAEVRSTKSNKVTAPNFGTGHAYGFCLDFTINGTSYDVRPQQPGESNESYQRRIKENTPAYERLSELLKKHGMKSVTGDPNHVTLSKYSKDPASLNKRREIVRRYLDKIAEERDKQVGELKAERERNKNLNAEKTSTDDLIKQANQEIDRLKDAIAKREAKIQKEQKKAEAKAREKQYADKNSDRQRRESEGGHTHERETTFTHDCVSRSDIERDGHGDIVRESHETVCRGDGGERGGGLLRD